MLLSLSKQVWTKFGTNWQMNPQMISRTLSMRLAMGLVRRRAALQVQVA
jgi:hypothetical protein